MTYVTLVNRSSKTLHGTWDGRHYDIAPGTHMFPETMAMKFREQNPLMGSEDPYTLQKKYLIGIVEMQDDCSPIEQSDKVEIWDRSKMAAHKQNVEVVHGEGLYSPARDGRANLPADATGTTFTKP